ncbi:GTP pyrophosphokinase [Spiroplasma sabaudiense Ar-1343]|uniref:Penta-phosphate guanosine-3'-pyrophosphohydrolase n=1 Tax=Spiroplasma sabaudiense Ar-1343 TaxID=1276257 RepID=W6AJ61_9MOLU|nr:RelA/SpoT family protein [Spiroplasma sabaudiense]AHI53749.1 GTP pyrophosphokinase [Spiroplasma sabaudiense Ar-1343]
MSRERAVSSFNFVEVWDYDTVDLEMRKYIFKPELLAEVREAYEFAEKAHRGQKRRNGDPYIIHPISTAYFLAQWRMGPKTVIAGLLHDIIEDTPITYEEIEKRFGTEVADLVEAVTKVTYFSKEKRQQIKAKYLKKLYLSMVKDIRVIIIKIADRLHNMATLTNLPLEKQQVIASETLEIYSSIAHRIGMKVAKTLLEDLSFKIINPEEYNRISLLLERDLKERSQTIDAIIDYLSVVLHDEKGLQNIEIFGRTKTIYSIYRKMTLFGKNFNDINDLLAVRIITDSVDECYQILGIVHQIFTPLSGRFKDYIATPKNNLYRSLHTTVSDKNGVIFEIQIRTFEMDLVAESGAAAHWRYKEDEIIDVQQKQKELDEKIDIFTRIIDLEKLSSSGVEFENQTDEYDKDKFLEKTIQSDFFTSSVYVLTPNGQVITLPFGSTVLDFAYRIHSEVGEHTTGAKINGVFSPINTILNSGEVIEIKTSSKQQPNDNWLKHAKTNAARSKIRKFLAAKNENETKSKKLNTLKLITETRIEINKYIEKNNLKWKVNSEEQITEKLKVLDYNSVDVFLLAVANKDFTIKEAVELVFVDNDINQNDQFLNQFRSKKYIDKRLKNDIIVAGIENIQTTISNCCLPIPFEDIIGYVSKNDGIKVHHTGCQNIQNEKMRSRLIKVIWNKDVVETKEYFVQIQIKGDDRPNLLFDITKTFSHLKSSVYDASVQVSDAELQVKGKFLVKVKDNNHLNQIVTNLRAMPNINFVERLSSAAE